LTRRDFQLIAQCLRAAPNIDDGARDRMAETFALGLAALYPRFDRARFLSVVRTGTDSKGNR
jgi:hypothetical protein